MKTHVASVAISLLLFAACGDEGLVAVAAPPKACSQDAECGTGEKCIEGGCRPLDLFNCDAPGGERQALIEVTPAMATFGAVAVHDQRTIPVTIRNVGTCMLNLSEVSVDRASSDDFFCENCFAGGQNVMLPFDERTVLVIYAPTDATPDIGTLNVVSDDRAYPLVQVPLRSSYEGAPKLVVDPPVLAFGYVTPGDSTDLTVRLNNDGTGNAALTITGIDIALDASVAYQKTAPPLPFYISPGGSVAVRVTYSPPNSPAASHEARLVVTSTDPTTPQVQIKLRGTSMTPPSMVISSEIVDFGNVPVATMATRIVTIRNQKKQPGDPEPTGDLVIRGFMQKTSATDFSYSPTLFAAIPPGGAIDILFRYTPTAVGTAQGAFTVISNDPSLTQIDVALRGYGAAAAGAKTMKVEMNFDNGGDSWADNDLRQVQMTMDNPVGDWCGKKRNAPNWGPYGMPTWFAFGQKDEPQRIVLLDANRDGEFPVHIHYIEDCSSVASGLVASILGIGISALLSYLTEGIINVNGQDVSAVIASICWSHSSSTVAVRVYLDGQLKLEKSLSVGRKGDIQEAVVLDRTAGVFTVKP